MFATPGVKEEGGGTATSRGSRGHVPGDPGPGPRGGRRRRCRRALAGRTKAATRDLAWNRGGQLPGESGTRAGGGGGGDFPQCAGAGGRKEGGDRRDPRGASRRTCLAGRSWDRARGGGGVLMSAAHWR